MLECLDLGLASPIADWWLACFFYLDLLASRNAAVHTSGAFQLIATSLTVKTR